MGHEAHPHATFTRLERLAMRIASNILATTAAIAVFAACENDDPLTPPDTLPRPPVLLIEGTVSANGTPVQNAGVRIRALHAISDQDPTSCEAGHWLVVADTSAVTEKSGHFKALLTVSTINEDIQAMPEIGVCLSLLASRNRNGPGWRLYESSGHWFRQEAEMDTVSVTIDLAQ